MTINEYNMLFAGFGIGITVAAAIVAIFTLGGEDAH